MKATINGVTVEGTPEEIWAILQRKQAEGTNLKPHRPMPDWNKPWCGIIPPPGYDMITITCQEPPCYHGDKWKPGSHIPTSQNDICTTTNVPMDYQKWG